MPRPILSPCRRAVAILALSGLSDREIGRGLGLTPTPSGICCVSCAAGSSPIGGVGGHVAVFVGAFALRVKFTAARITLQFVG
jgi:hypothetical protein